MGEVSQTPEESNVYSIKVQKCPRTPEESNIDAEKCRNSADSGGVECL